MEQGAGSRVGGGDGLVRVVGHQHEAAVQAREDVDGELKPNYKRKCFRTYFEEKYLKLFVDSPPARRRPT